jgi:hypothetical protein
MRLCTGIVLALAVVAMAGCKRSEYTFAEVQGHVTQNGQPKPNVVVCFWPDIEAGTKAPRATAVTDATGYYRLRCDEGTDGAVIGRYRVCLTTFTIGKTSAASPNSKAVAAATSPIPDRYGSFRDTPIRDIEIKPGAVQTFDFTISASK